MSDENNHNLSTLLDTESDDGIIDQAADLHNVNCAVLYHLPIPLQTPAQFNIWCIDVSNVLRRWGLNRLIDRSIPRPNEDSPNLNRWMETSKAVRKWLAWNMNSTLVVMIESIHGRSMFADEFMYGTKRVFREMGPVVRPHHHIDDMIDALIRVINCKRIGCPDAKAFVYRLLEYYWHTKNMQMNIPAFLPLSILLRELDSEFHELIEEKLNALFRLPNAAQNVTSEDFAEHCYDVIRYIESNEADGDSGMGVYEETMGSEDPDE